MRFLRTWLAVATLAAVIGSCGLSTDASPRAIAFEDLPGAFDPEARPTATPQGGSSIVVFMVGPDDRLRTVERSISEGLTAEARAEAALQSLIFGTSPNEVRNFGITSSISTDSEVAQVLTRDDGVLVVDLIGGNLPSSSIQTRRLAFAQIVYTVTELPTIDSVIFLLDDELVSVPTDDAVLPRGTAVDRSNFLELDPRNSIAFDEETLSDVNPVIPTPIDFVPEVLADDLDDEAPDTEIEQVVWMVAPDGTIQRRARSADRDPGRLLRRLLEGPSAEEQALGFRSSLLPGAVALSADDLPVDETTGTAFVDLGAESLPSGVVDDERLRAVAQIVYTLTEFREIDRVEISVLGAREPLPTQNGLSEPGAALGRDDFSALVGEAVFGVTTPTPTPTRTPDPAPDEGGQASATDTAGTPPEGTATPTATSTPTPTPTPITGTPTPTPSPTATPFPLVAAPTATP